MNVSPCTLQAFAFFMLRLQTATTLLFHLGRMLMSNTHVQDYRKNNLVLLSLNPDHTCTWIHLYNSDGADVNTEVLYMSPHICSFYLWIMKILLPFNTKLWMHSAYRKLDQQHRSMQQSELGVCILIKIEPQFLHATGKQDDRIHWTISATTIWNACTLVHIGAQDSV